MTLVTLALSWILAGLAPLAQAGTSAFPTAATVTSADGVVLQATWGQPAKASTNGVVFVHMNGRSKEDWAGVAQTCWEGGAYVLTFDLRGMGGNIPAGTVAAALTPDDYQKMLGDVRAAVELLKSKGVTNVALVGAELGANLVINVAADDASIVDVVLISPGFDYKGIIATDAIKRYGARPIYMVGAEDDMYGLQSIARFDADATGPKQITVFPSGGKGTKLLIKQPELEGTLVGWVTTHWTATTTAP